MVKNINDDFLCIQIPFWGKEYDVLEDVINMGIDSRLEEFTKSLIGSGNGVLNLYFHKTEIQIVVRRLLEIGGVVADRLAETIVGCVFKDYLETLTGMGQLAELCIEKESE